ncbi:MAG TPA: response regulator [Spirochaetia bacterium]|nr:response regulator [Spirochaetia bacterium]
MNPCRVLIVDDEQIVRLAVKSMVDWSAGTYCLAGTAADGEAALALYEAEGADIVVTDLKMPRMDGIALIRSLVASDFPPEILVLSNYDDFELVREALRLGVYDYILKTSVEPESFRLTLDQMRRKLESRLLVSGDRPGHRRDRIPDQMSRGIDSLAVCNLDVLLKDTVSCSAFLLLIADRAEKRKGRADFLSMIGALTEETVKNPVRRFAAALDKDTYLVAVVVEEGENVKAETVARRIVDGAALYYQADIGIVYSDSLSRGGDILGELDLCLNAAELFFWRESFVIHSHVKTPEAEEITQRLNAAENALTAAGLSPASIAEALPKIVSDILSWCATFNVSPLEAKRHIKRLYRLLELRLSVPEDRADSLAELFLSADDAVAASSSEAELLAAVIGLANGIGERTAHRAALRSEVKAVMDWVDDHISDKVSVFELSSRLRISETYLCTLFKSQTGMSIVNWANERKLEVAKAKLESGAYLIKEVAAEVGIDDPFYFNRLFKRKYGVAPSDLVPRSGEKS